MRPLTFLVVLVIACAPVADPVTTTTVLPATTTSTTVAVEPVTTTTTRPETSTSTLVLQGLEYVEIADLPFPIQVTARPGGDIAYVITKDGRVFALLEDGVGEEPVLDIRPNVINEGERGLLGIALHPTDGSRFYLHYSGDGGDTVVSEWVLTNPEAADPASERVLLRLDQPAANHNGGMIQFLPDGRLLLGLGDGGGAGDVFGNAQNLDTLLGGLVALSVEGDPDPELYAYGLRNPWRFWIDGDLIYIADVGQNAFEEINVAPLTPGLNYGWPITEGLHCFRPSSGCPTDGLTLPVIEIGHGDSGTCSVTGGVVYRGPIAELDGTYFYSDYCGGYLRSFRYEGGEVTDETDWTDQVGGAGAVAGFGVDGAGNVYVATTERLLWLRPVLE